MGQSFRGSLGFTGVHWVDSGIRETLTPDSTPARSHVCQCSLTNPMGFMIKLVSAH